MFKKCVKSVFAHSYKRYFSMHLIGSHIGPEVNNGDVNVQVPFILAA